MPAKKKSQVKYSQKVGTKKVVKKPYEVKKPTHTPLRIKPIEDLENIKNRLGLSKRDTESKVKFVLQNLMDRSPRGWNQLGITKQDFSDFGITFVQK